VRTTHFFTALLLSGCTHNRPVISDPPATSLASAAISGAQQAHRDIAAGRLQLMEAGTHGVCAPCVPNKGPSLRNATLPRHRLPNGCTTPGAPGWIRYAEAYNAVVVAQVKKQTRR